MITVTGGGESHGNSTLLDNAGNNTSGDNVVYVNRDSDGNIEAGGNMTYYVDGSSSVSLKARTCWPSCYVPPVTVAEPPTSAPSEPRIWYWSNPDDWDNLPGRIPIDGDEIEIKQGWTMVFDILESPKLKSLHINGHLSLAEGADRSISAYNIWVRAGTFEIGSSSNPFPNKVTITLLGDMTEGYWAFSFGIPSQNKNFVVTGTVNFWGNKRSRGSRLL